MRGCHDRDAPAAAHAGHRQPLGHLAHLVDRDRLAVVRSAQPVQIGMRPGAGEQALGTFPAGLERRAAPRAEQRRRQCTRESLLADARPGRARAARAADDRPRRPFRAAPARRRATAAPTDASRANSPASPGSVMAGAASSAAAHGGLHVVDRSGGVDHADALRLAPRPGEVGRAHALEELARARPRSGRALPRAVRPARARPISTGASSSSVRSGSSAGCASGPARRSAIPAAPRPPPW